MKRLIASLCVFGLLASVTSFAGGDEPIYKQFRPGITLTFGECSSCVKYPVTVPIVVMYPGGAFSL